MSRKPLIYLASPYSHRDEGLKLRRFEEVNKIAAQLILQGFHVFVPISMSHPIAEASGLDMGGWEIENNKFTGWKDLDTNILSRCDEFWVVEMEGWDTSVGVRAEFEFAYRDMQTYLLRGLGDISVTLVPLLRNMKVDSNRTINRRN